MLARRVALASAVSAAAAFTSAHARAARMAPLTVPTLTGVAAAPLLPLPSSAGAAPITAGSLWAERPAVVMVVRRPGCQLCRAEASKLHKVAPQLEAAGVRLVAVLQEDLPEQVAEFSAQYWPGELYLDQDKALFAAVGGGAVRRGSLLTFLNPFSRVWCVCRVRRSALAAAQRAQRGATTALAARATHAPPRATHAPPYARQEQRQSGVGRQGQLHGRWPDLRRSARRAQEWRRRIRIPRGDIWRPRAARGGPGGGAARGQGVSARARARLRGNAPQEVECAGSRVAPAAAQTNALWTSKQLHETRRQARRCPVSARGGARGARCRRRPPQQRQRRPRPQAARAAAALAVRPPQRCAAPRP